MLLAGAEISDGILKEKLMSSQWKHFPELGDIFHLMTCAAPSAGTLRVSSADMERRDTWKSGIIQHMLLTQ